MTWVLRGTKKANLNISLKEWLDVTIFFFKKGPFWPKTHWKWANMIGTTDRLLNIQFKSPYLVSQAFVIFNKLSRAEASCESINLRSMPQQKGWTHMHFILIGRGKRKKIPLIMVNLTLWLGWGKRPPSWPRWVSSFLVFKLNILLGTSFYFEAK